MMEHDPPLVKKRAPNGLGALHMAVRYADREMLARLVSMGAERFQRKSMTPLFLAVKEPYVNAQFRLAHGADICVSIT